MSLLLDEFYGDTGAHGRSGSIDELEGELSADASSFSREAEALRLEEDIPIFKALRVEFRPTKEHGRITSLAVGNDVLVLGTSNCYVVRCHMEEEVKKETVETIIVSRRTDDSIANVFICPRGVHCIISLASGHNFYLHSSWNKPKLLTKLRSVVIESIGWDVEALKESSTGSFLVGGRNGCVYEVVIEEKDKAVKELFNLNLSDRQAIPVSGLVVERFPVREEEKEPTFLVLASTPNRFYEFVGGPTFEAIFQDPRYEVPSCVEFPSDLDYSELHSFRGDRVGAKCAWLTGPGVYSGQLALHAAKGPAQKVLTGVKLVGYPPDPHYTSGRRPADAVAGIAPTRNPAPISMALSAFHYLLLYPDRLLAINQLSQELVYKETFHDLPYGEMRKLAADPTRGTLWMSADRDVFEIEVDVEDRGVWKLCLDQGRFDEALQYCKTSEQEYEVLNTHADHLLQQGQFEEAAAKYAETERSFEEVSLRFVSCGADAALKTYLLARLRQLDPKARTQQTMICTWLTELYLDKLDRLARPKAGEEKLESQEAVLSEFHEFLDDYSDCFNPQTTFELLASHGQMDVLLFFAVLINDLDWVVEHHIRRREWSDALRILATPRAEELYYKFAPELMRHAPVETVDMLIRMEQLRPSKLLPALFPADSSSACEQQVAEARRYLESVVKAGNRDSAVHNFLLAMYAEAEDETQLLKFIEQQSGQASPPAFDFKFALRLCHRHGRALSSVALYTHLGFFSDALRLALEKDDLELAKKVVRQAGSDVAHAITSEEQDTLWLEIAKHVIKREQGVTAAMEVLAESGLPIEQLLPFFPDFVRIGEFKDEICRALEAYNERIQKLKLEMQDYTEAANEIRADVLELRNRSQVVMSNQRCDLCRQPVLTRHFLAFPCSHVFHADCVMVRVRTYLLAHPRSGPSLVYQVYEDARKELQQTQATRTVERKEEPVQAVIAPAPVQHARKELFRREESEVLAPARPAHESAATEETRRVLNALSERALLQIAGAECLFCGSIMLDEVVEPFIHLPEEDQEAASWEI